MSKPSGKKLPKSLVALSSAAVLGVYSAGFIKTRAAAEKFAEEPVRRRPMVPVAPSGEPAAPAAAVSSMTPLPGTPTTMTVDRQPSATTTQVPAETPRATSSDAKVQTVETKAAAAEPVAPAAPMPAPLAAITSSTPTALAAVQQLAGLPGAALLAPPPAAKWKDGTFLGWGTCRHGDIQAKVVVAEGKITSATIAQCLTRYSCSWISPLPPQVVTRQGPETDFVSGATDSTNAFYFAVVEALSLAKNK